MDETFGELLGQLLYKEYRSQAWLARQVGVSEGTVSRWVNDVTQPDSPQKVDEILRALCVRDDEQRRKLLRAAGFGYWAPPQESSPADETAPSLDVDKKENVSLWGLDEAFTQVRQLWEELSDWGKIPTPAPYSWQSKLLHVLRGIGERISAANVLWLTVAFAL